MHEQPPNAGVSKTWFSSTHRYEGPSRVEYTDPVVIVRGTAVAELGESERSLVEFWVDEEAGPEGLEELGVLHLMTGVTKHRGERVVTFDVNPTEAVIPSRLVIETPEGVFSSKSVRSEGLKIGGAGSELLCFSLLRAEFDANGAGDAEYWVLPLFNFTAEFVRAIEEHEEHPLRLPSPENVQRPPGCGRSRESARGVIPFSYRGHPGFIQPLPDYFDRVAALRDGRAARLVTALMVGKLGDLPTDLDSLMEWFPFDYLYLLSITSGNFVGMRWIEFRDAKRRLVRRVYIPSQLLGFSQGGHRTITDAINTSTGLLLSDAPKSAYWNNPGLRVVLGYLRRSANTSVVEDRFLDLARAFEGLFRLHALTLPTLLQQLDPDVRKDVGKELKESVERMKAVSTRLRAVKRDSQANVAHRIATRIPGSAERSGSLGEMVAALLDKFGFPDAAILEAHYAQRSPTKRQSWADDLSYYRNQAAHGGYFDLGPGQSEITHVFRMSNHILDMLLRIVFKMLGYSGTYQPPVSILTDDRPVEWVQPNTSAKALGYS
jgi:hypothetical protein